MLSIEQAIGIKNGYFEGDYEDYIDSIERIFPAINEDLEHHAFELAWDDLEDSKYAH